MEDYEAPWIHANTIKFKKTHKILLCSKIIPHNYAWIQATTWKRTNTKEKSSRIMKFFLKFCYWSSLHSLPCYSPWHSHYAFSPGWLQRPPNWSSSFFPCSSTVCSQHSQNHPGNHESDLVTLLLKSLQWLPISHRGKTRVLTMVYITITDLNASFQYDTLLFYTLPGSHSTPATITSLFFLKALGAPTWILAGFISCRSKSYCS